MPDMNPLSKIELPDGIMSGLKMINLKTQLILIELFIMIS